MGLGQGLATIAYGQLVAENAAELAVAPEIVATIFHLLVADLTASALALAAWPGLDSASQSLTREMIAIPQTNQSDWDLVANRVVQSAS
jgi:hypothetical protein